MADGVALTRTLAPDPLPAAPRPGALRRAGRRRPASSPTRPTTRLDAQRAGASWPQAVEEAARAVPGAERILSVSTGVADTSPSGPASTPTASRARGAAPTSGSPPRWRCRTPTAAARRTGTPPPRRFLAVARAAPRRSGAAPPSGPWPASAPEKGESARDAAGGGRARRRPAGGRALRPALRRGAPAEALLPGGEAGRGHRQPAARPRATTRSCRAASARASSTGRGWRPAAFPVFERGVLRSYYVDTYYGRKLGMAPTTGRASNLAWALGPTAATALLADAGRGVLVTGFLGGNSNRTTGDFSLGRARLPRSAAAAGRAGGGDERLREPPRALEPAGGGRRTTRTPTRRCARRRWCSRGSDRRRLIEARVASHPSRGGRPAASSRPAARPPPASSPCRSSARWRARRRWWRPAPAG